MKVSLLSVLLFLSGMVKATNYYVDASTTSAIQNGTLASPWKTLSQVSSNMSSFVAGDIISFKKGGTYPGQLVVNRSGAAETQSHSIHMELEMHLFFPEQAAGYLT